MKFYRISLSALIVLFCIIGTTQAQNLDEIVANHLKAHGDMKVWDNAETMTIHANFTGFSADSDFYAIKTKEGHYYSTFDLGRHSIIEAFDGQNGWTIDPWHDIYFPRKINKNERNAYFQRIEFFTPFYKYKEKGYELEYVGEENVDGYDTYVIKLKRQNDFEETWYLNKETYLAYKYVARWVDFASPTMAETFFDDYTEVNGIVYPFFIERMFPQRDRIYIIEKIEFNKPFDYSKLEMPRSSEMEKLADLEGDWGVKVSTWGRNNAYREADQNTANAKFTATNNLFLHIGYSGYYDQSRDLNINFNKDKKKYLLNVYNDFSSNSHSYEGVYIDGILTFEKLKDASDEPSTKLFFSNVNDNSFTIEMKVSRDQGETWQNRIKFEFSK